VKKMHGIDQALDALRKHTPLPEIESSVPRAPGLYAVYADGKAWKALGLGEPPDRRPLYVGKSESSLRSRDIRTHFRDGRTGSSTVRRSFAALLRDELGLEAMPRNPTKPARFAYYGVSLADDAKLTAWMRANVRLAIWPSSEAVPLERVEREVLHRLQPPLNLKDVSTPWQPLLKAARAAMAAEAKAWAHEQGVAAQ
jgi:hypothetical protein